MKFLERLNQRLGFTRNESLVVLFLVGSLMVGGAVKLFKGLTEKPGGTYDYSRLDEEFARRSQLASAGFTQGKENSRADSSGFRTAAAVSRLSPGKLKSPPDKKINLNTATKEELMRLPGIGETTAERIILYRENYGAYETVEDLLEVKGIGKKKLERLTPYVTAERE